MLKGIFKCLCKNQFFLFLFHLFVHSFIRSFIYWFIHLFIQSFIYLIIIVITLSLDNCKNIKCSGSKTCLLDQNLKPHCVRCRQSCPPVKLGSGSGPVCGVDNITYPSYCHLQRASCLSGRSIQAAYRGDCKRKFVK